MKPDGISRPDIQLRLEVPDGEAARRCHALYFLELAARFEEGFDPGDTAYAGKAGAPGNVRTVIAWQDGQAIGCGSLLIGGDAIGEIKRMWVSPAARGLGIARLMLAFLEGVARDEKLARLRLDTNRALGEAQIFYRRSGYSGIDRYNGNPYAHHWFEKVL